MRNRPVVVTLLSSALYLIACADADIEEPTSTASTSTAEHVHPSPDSRDQGQSPDSHDSFSFRTSPARIEPGQERYLCYTQTLDEDLIVDRYDHEAQPQVHHIVFVRSLAPEPEGFSECDTLFRTTWDPLFVTGAGRATLAFPENAGHTLTKGTQLLVQLHLLNSSTSTIEEPVEIKLHRSSVSNPIPVGTYTFGTLRLNVPANQASQVQAGCEMKEDLQIIAGFPHMHQMGRSLRFESGSGDDSMQTKFLRDPYTFDDQHVEPLDLALSAGDMTRVTCDYENATTNDVMFGESTSNEMCFFIAFALNRNQISGCIR